MIPGQTIGVSGRLGVFKRLVLSSALIFFLMLISLFFETEEVFLINENLSNGFFESYDDKIFLTISIIFIIGLIVNYYLLYNFISIARIFFVILVIISIVLTLLIGPSISGPFLSTLEYLIAVIDGALLILLYFSPIKEKFKY